MKRFLMTFLAVISAQVFLAILGVAALFFVAGLMMISTGGTPAAIPASGFLWQTIPPDLPEFIPESSLPLPQKQLSHTDILENLEKAAIDVRIRGVVLDCDFPQIGWGKLQELRTRIAAVQTAGKPVIFYSTFATNKAFYLAAACDSFVLHPQGFLQLGGLNIEALYARDLLDRLGVQYQVSRIKEYKSMAEVFIRNDMSPEARANATWILEDIYADLVSTIAADRGLDQAVVTDWFEVGLYNSTEAKADGLIDDHLHKEELETRLRIGSNQNDWIDGADYTDVSRASLSLQGSKIAVIHGEGLITSGESGFVFPFGTSMGDETMVAAIYDALDNKAIKGILLRLDTGGGLTTASDRIRQAVAEACSLKPVVISMVDVTASGGYMASYPCQTLVALPNSIVGSIGSINMRSDISGLFNKAGVSIDRVTVGPHAAALSPFNTLTDNEFDRLEVLHWDMYDRWIADIARHRGKKKAEIDSIGRGRVFTGRQALDNGLIDQLGGFDLSLELLKDQIGIPSSEAVSFVHLPVQKSLLEKLVAGEFTSAGSSLFPASDQSETIDQTLSFWARCLQREESLSLLWWRF